MFIPGVFSNIYRHIRLLVKNGQKHFTQRPAYIYVFVLTFRRLGEGIRQNQRVRRNR